MYEKSFMHRDTVTQVAVAQDQDFLITGSIDGHLKFWKKTPTGIEFAKHYRAHAGSLDGIMHCISTTVCSFGMHNLHLMIITELHTVCS